MINLACALGLLHVQLRLHEAWHVPELLGKLPESPECADSVEEKGKYALFAMLLFQPWRNGEDILRKNSSTYCKGLPPKASEEKTQAVYHELYQSYVRWEEDLDLLAKKAQSGRVHFKLKLDSRYWWAVLTSRRLKFLKAVCAKHGSSCYTDPKDASLLPRAPDDLLPEECAVHPQESEELPKFDICSSDENWDEALPGDLGEEEETGQGNADDGKQGYPTHSPHLPLPCGKVHLHFELPLADWATDATIGRGSARGQGGHFKYLEEFFRRRNSFFPSPVELPQTLAKKQPLLTPEQSDRVRMLTNQQHKYFRELDDTAVTNEKMFLPVTRAPTAEENSTAEDWERRFLRLRMALRERFPKRSHTHSIVMEATFFLLTAGILNHPGTNVINIKQGLALLHIAVWLQTTMSERWTKEHQIRAQDWSSTEDWEARQTLLMALMGPAGTGKTSVVRVAIALCEHFLGENTTVRSAPTNTAARLFEGDTCHSWWKLPPKNLQGKRQWLSNRVLEKFRQRWKDKVIEFTDEISMLAPELLHQGDMRKKAAKNNFERPMGGVANVASGDMLQLPPVALLVDQERNAQVH